VATLTGLGGTQRA